jgi:putative hydroxymethylpyrimidine transport system ATP-binding protein
MSQENKTAIKFDEVSFQYGRGNAERPILNKLTFSIPKGEFVSIVGASGSGKSTIFRLIVGLEQPNEGDISFNGRIEQSRFGKVGYMPQQDLLMPWRTIRQNAQLVPEIKRKRDDKQVQILLKEFGLEGYEDKYPHELSGGMKQRVSFLRATLSGSDILLLDEPFSALDAMTKMYMQEWLLEQWEKQQSTILFITHDISEALFLSDRVYIVKETPITSLHSIEVPINRPRTRNDLDKREVILLKNQLIEQFRTRMS